MFQEDECSAGWVSRGMGVPVTLQTLGFNMCLLLSPTDLNCTILMLGVPVQKSMLYEKKTGDLIT